MATRVETMFSRAGVLLLLLAGLLAPAAAVGQEPIVPLQFSFSDPGARSMGFGGAFVALADDATAAFANPAGLVQLARPEVSIEFRRWSYSTPFTESGRVEGLPSGFGIDTTVGLTTARSEDDVTGLSFLSVAYPSDRWSVAFFRHLLADFEFSSETQGLFGGGTECCQIRFFDQRVTTDLEFVSYGLSGAYRIGESFDLGLGLIYHESSFTSRTSVFLPDDDSLPSLFALNSYFPDRLLVSRTLFGDDTDWSLIGGFLWRLSNRWSVGGVYRQGPEVRISDEFAAGEAVDLGVPPGGVLFRSADVVQFPQVYGLGLAYRAPEGGLTVSFQWDHIEYSSIVESTGRDDRVRRRCRRAASRR